MSRNPRLGDEWLACGEERRKGKQINWSEFVSYSDGKVSSRCSTSYLHGLFFATAGKFFAVV